MNQKRRKKIREVIVKLEACESDLTCIKDEEDDARDNMPESLQDSDRYIESEEYSDKIDESLSGIREAIDNLEEI